VKIAQRRKIRKFSIGLHGYGGARLATLTMRMKRSARPGRTRWRGIKPTVRRGYESGGSSATAEEKARSGQPPADALGFPDAGQEDPQETSERISRSFSVGSREVETRKNQVAGERQPGESKTCEQPEQLEDAQPAGETAGP